MTKITFWLRGSGQPLEQHVDEYNRDWWTAVLRALREDEYDDPFVTLLSSDGTQHHIRAARIDVIKVQ
jgi:hypothetical protein